jgi:putative membrane protein
VIGLLIIKGFVIGLLMLVPGLSGGSIAVGLGIYEEILAKSSRFFKDFKTNFFYFLKLIIGGIIGMFVSSFSLLLLMKYNANMVLSLMIIIMTFILIRHFRSYYKELTWWHYSFIVLGFVISLIFNNMKVINIKNEYLMMVLSGLLLAIAFILPGISFSYVLVILGLYDKTLIAILTLDFLFIIKLGVAFLFGIILTIKLIDVLYQRFPRQMNNVIVGFVISSILFIVPINDIASFFYVFIMVIIGIIVSLFKFK